MGIALTKMKLVELQTELGQMLDYDENSIEGETWYELADYTRELASLIASMANRMAGHSGHCTRMANKGNEEIF